MPIWDDVLTKKDRAIVEKSGYGVKRNFGEKPCLIVVDMQKFFVGEKPCTTFTTDNCPPNGEWNAWHIVGTVKLLLKAFREKEQPVIYLMADKKPNEKLFDSFAYKQSPDKVKSMLAGGQQIVEEIAPLQDEVVIRKKYASGFFGTPLMSFLNTLHTDTLIVCGVTTSGCVRATVVDAVSYNFNVGIVEEAVADRIEISHKVSLFDMDFKYGDVVKLEEVLKYLDSL